MEVCRFYQEGINGLEQKTRLYRQEDYYLLSYAKALFKITGVKACRLISESKSQDFIVLMAIDGENMICFYSFYLSNMNDKEQTNQVIFKRLGEESIENFEYFVYFYRKELEKQKRNLKQECTSTNSNSGDNTEKTDFILQALQSSFKEVGGQYYLYPYADSKEAFEEVDEEYKIFKITTFIKLTKEILMKHSVFGHDFKVLRNYTWDGSGTSACWKNYYKDWILSFYNELFDIQKFCVCRLNSYANLFKNAKVIPWRANDVETFVFVTENSDSSNLLKDGIVLLYDCGIDKAIPGDIKVDKLGNPKEKPVFWHWNRAGIPHVILKRDSENETYEIWYREVASIYFLKFECVERPTVFYDTYGNHIYFAKTKENTHMLVLNHALELVFHEASIIFFEEISPTKKYSNNLKRKVQEHGRYFARKNWNSFVLERNNILIVKKKIDEEKEVFGVWWNDSKFEVDVSTSFVSYSFVNKELPDGWTTKTIELESDDITSDEKSHYISIWDKKITMLENVI